MSSTFSVPCHTFLGPKSFDVHVQKSLYLHWHAGGELACCPLQAGSSDAAQLSGFLLDSRELAVLLRASRSTRGASSVSETALVMHHRTQYNTQPYTPSDEDQMSHTVVSGRWRFLSTKVSLFTCVWQVFFGDR